MSGTRPTILLHSAGTYGGTTCGTKLRSFFSASKMFPQASYCCCASGAFLLRRKFNLGFYSQIFHEILIHYNLIISTAIGIAHFLQSGSSLLISWQFVGYCILGQHAGSTVEQALIPAKYDTRADPSESHQPNSLCNKFLPATTSSRNVGSHNTDHAS